MSYASTALASAGHLRRRGRRRVRAARCESQEAPERDPYREVTTTTPGRPATGRSVLIGAVTSPALATDDGSTGCARSAGSDAGVVVRDDHAHGTRHGGRARESARLGPGSLAALWSGSASRNSSTPTLGEFHAVDRRPTPGQPVFTSRSGAGEGVRTLDPYLGKVPLSFCIRQGPKAAIKRVLTPNFDGDPR